IMVVIVILDSIEVVVVVVIDRIVVVHLFGILHCVSYGEKHDCCDEEIEFYEVGVDGFEEKDCWVVVILKRTL
ncbi:hypothetical protein Tco_1116260, partial [Tanacetum coccineum]